MKYPILLTTLALVSATAGAAEIVSTPAYSWHGDTISQGPYMATAPNEYRIESTYSAQPGYGFPIEKVWQRKNDLSAYPHLTTPNTLHAAIYNMGLDEMVNAVEPDTTLRTGKEWAGVWTRDVSYSILLSMSYLQPEAARISLEKKVNKRGVIVQDTGSGGAWPVSSDRQIWALAAFEVYKATGDRKWLEYIYPVIVRSLADDALTVASPNGLVRGETSFVDWREQSYPKWMQNADIYSSEALSTSVVHSAAYTALGEMAKLLGKKKEAEQFAKEGERIAHAINEHLWMKDKGYYAMYTYGRTHHIVNPRAETLGESLAILYGIADEQRARLITENNPTTPFGVGIFFPQIADMTPYHNNALWPWVGAYWAIANAKAQNEEGTLEAIGAVFRPAALFATNKENFVLDNGDIATELNSSNMLWCLAGNLAITNRILFGINYTVDGLEFRPFVPQALAAERTLSNFKYRNSTLDITVKGYGSEIKSFTVNGKESKPVLPGNIKRHNTIVITMADNKVPALKVNHTPNVKAPLTPATWVADGMLHWNTLDYASHYDYVDHFIVLRNGQPIGTTDGTSYPLGAPGEYQVIGVTADGVESFASEPLSTRALITAKPTALTTTLASPEASYQPRAAIRGYTGAGFAETDQKSGAVTFDINVPADGNYALKLRYANGNGPINTENKCAIRTLSLDNNRIGVVVMPQRGGARWSDWGKTNTLVAPLTAGKHTVTVDYRPENANMNIDTNHAIIDRLELEKID